MKQICLLASIILLSLGAFMGLEGTQTELSQTSSKSLTGFVYDDVYLRHLPGRSGHPERPERLTAILKQVGENRPVGLAPAHQATNRHR